MLLTIAYSIPVEYDIGQDTPLDPGIERAVHLLREAGIETFESCEGGNGHAYPEPTIRFHGDRSEGYRAVAKAIQSELPVDSLRRIWPVEDGELTGPWWELTLARRLPTTASQLS